MKQAKYTSFIFSVNYLKLSMVLTTVCLLMIRLLSTYLHVQFSYSNRLIKDDETCAILLTQYSKLAVSLPLLHNLISVCQWNSDFQHNRFNMSFFNKSIFNFSCPCKVKYVQPQTTFIAIASLPGSGNTMTRFLIQSVTGFTTSYVTKNKACPFGRKNFLVKTHKSDNLVLNTDCIEKNITRLVYRKAIFILRNPYNAILAEYKRRHSGSTFHEPKLNKTFYLTEEWKVFVRVKSERWKNMAIYWLSKFHKPTHLVVYEEIVNNPLVKTFNLLQFLELKVDFRSLYCVFANCVDNKNRLKPSWLQNITLPDIYDYQERKMINTHILNTSKILKMKVMKRYVLE